MNTFIQDKLDFSIFILQLNFFNALATSERCFFTQIAHPPHPSAFSSAQPQAVLVLDDISKPIFHSR